DVDTASYANVRRYLTQGQLPPPEAVRVEEMINYFDYEYATPRGEDPISVDVEIAQCVWETQHRLARIALKAREVPMDDRGPANLVFLIDVSGSMKDSNKLPLLKESMKALTRRLLPQDRVAIVTYRDAASIALSPTTVGDRTTIETAIDALHAEGSTNGAGGLELAYSIASQNVVSESINRVILATDGDFNVGETDNDRLVELIRNSAATGVFLTVLGFGEGNLKDDRLEAMADKGNGAYHYIDNYNEATRVLCAQVDGTLATVAKDVKVQIEFNPQHVAAYRLIGYENRALAAADFNNDRKDAGEMGSGESMTALYELVPVGASTTSGRGVDELKYQANPAPAPQQSGDVNPETMTVKVRYKEPEGDASRKFEVPVVDRGEGYDQSSRDYRWAVAVAGFGMLLRHPASHTMTFVNEDGTRILGINTVVSSPVPDSLTFAKVREIAEGANGYDPDGRRAEFISLVVSAQTLMGDRN
ncbi:MAG: von Willebrand factor type A domain-containing protein, partial [Candidatus Hydrogenedentes bacterium]|nr:von Willebrand factor type A domain-containing protein [Candidatus Hydrogenedentota bacterium]